jgi:hypothetical protein
MFVCVLLRKGFEEGKALGKVDGYVMARLDKMRQAGEKEVDER